MTTFNIDTHSWGGSGIGKTVFRLICNMVPEGGTIVELGGGYCSTVAFSSRYNLYTVEDNNNFMNKKIDTTWIYAPKRNGWYDRKTVEAGLPREYDLLFIDGPAGAGNRNGILENLDLIPDGCKIVLHDTHRDEERWLSMELAKKLDRKALFFNNGISPSLGLGLNDYWCYLAKHDEILTFNGTSEDWE